jgi:hypothetical protein
MDRVVIGFNFAEFSDVRKRNRQQVAIEVLENLPDNFYPIAFDFIKSESIFNFNINKLNILKRNSLNEIGNDRNLPYVKEILNYLNKIDCDKFGIINSDILLNHKFIKLIEKDFDAFILPRYDISEVSSSKFINNDFNVIYGGDGHIGADGFFFKKKWWDDNSHLFPQDLILGETEWDTSYRYIIKNNCDNYIEERSVYHVYHDAKWTLNSKGAKNNIKIWESFGD